ncbi:Hint domain-containing protein [Catalinimonas alkaloidigena]|uniref:Hint domain-containing protein n=1 Tax=Catalinimonas alkaloidigena TaxID=1075417 RepID=UPI0024058250|nr:Hint domain-containing protein [Catalinimonas alkaloidigena]
MKRTFYPLFIAALMFCSMTNLLAQDSPRGMTKEEYELAITATVEDLDNDTYVKVGSGDYVLDRYEMKPPYFITGDSGVKKRLDVYKLIDRASMGELGLVVFFTNTEANETFNLVIPNMATTGDVWNMYFDDIHQHDREEGDVALKMSYVLSKEVAYLMQKSSGVDMSVMDQENSDYDFCFAADALVSMADGSAKTIEMVNPGDQVLAYENGQFSPVTVEAVNVHRKQSIALSKAILFPLENITASAADLAATEEMTELVATANHPVMTESGVKALGDLQSGDVLYKYNAQTQSSRAYQVHFITNQYASVREVYSLEVAGESYLVSEMVVMEK